MAIDTPEKYRMAVLILAETWSVIGTKGIEFEYHYNELRKLVKEFL